MSFTQIKQAPVRLHRSQLFVLSTDPSAIEAAARSEADVIFFELQDAVVPAQKANSAGDLTRRFFRPGKTGVGAVVAGGGLTSSVAAPRHFAALLASLAPGRCCRVRFGNSLRYR